MNVAVTLGSYIEPFMRGCLKNATLTPVAPPATSQAELMSRRADVIMTDFPSAIRMTKEFEGTRCLLPPGKLAVTPYAYVVPQGNQVWLNHVNLFVDTIKLDGRLAAAAARHGLGPIVAPKPARNDASGQGKWPLASGHFRDDSFFGAVPQFGCIGVFAVQVPEPASLPLMGLALAPGSPARVRMARRSRGSKKVHLIVDLASRLWEPSCSVEQNTSNKQGDRK